MSNGINKVILLGNLGNDPELSATGANRAYCKFSIATGESWKNKQTGVKEERTEWHSIVVFDRLAEVCAQYLRKGSKVFLEGKLKTSDWIDKNTQEKKYRTDIVAHEMRMLDSVDGQNQAPPQQPQQQQAPQQAAPQQAPQQQPAPQQNARANPNGTAKSPYAAQQPQVNQHPASTAEPDPFDDDIPF